MTFVVKGTGRSSYPGEQLPEERIEAASLLDLLESLDGRAGWLRQSVSSESGAVLAIRHGDGWLITGAALNRTVSR